MALGSQPAPGVGDAVRAAADVGQADMPEGRLTVGRKDPSGTVWATPLGRRNGEPARLDLLHSGRGVLRRLHEVIGADQRFAQAIGVLIDQALAIEAGVCRVNDAVMVRADHHDVAADIRAASRQVLHVVGLRVGEAVLGIKVLAADLAAVLVVRLEAVGEVLIGPRAGPRCGRGCRSPRA